ncbi:hypothetical protein IFM89_014560 [Coptis chinensis]|uniref:Uncharacterized protein n=1 Tax=Coptis chinensis TaxID=261450 RepID=A0A835LF45_9MAGN|nr:hypothetical protein IFM89_014560 [Coptis chinensis]
MGSLTEPVQVKEKIDLAEKEKQIFDLLLAVVNEYLLITGEEKQKRYSIHRNPDQSKHLETENMTLFGEQIDFVNLRSENYYLKSGKIVTPLPPKYTFLDDPLRVLRAIRFVAKFGFVLDEELKKAAASDEVKAAIVGKVSRERIGKEIDLMISGNDPVRAMIYICDLQLFWVVFSVPREFEHIIFEGCNRLCVRYVSAAWSLLQVVGFETFHEEQRKLYLFGALFLPLGELQCANRIVSHILRNSPKGAKDANNVIRLHKASEKILSVIPSMTPDNIERVLEDSELLVSVTSRQLIRVELGFLLLEDRELESLWRATLLISILISSGTDYSHMESFLKTGGELYRRIENTIVDLGLDNVWKMEKLVDGNVIMSALQLKQGPRVREWKRRSLRWQLAHRYGTLEECLDWMKSANIENEKRKHDQSRI